MPRAILKFEHFKSLGFEELCAQYGGQRVRLKLSLVPKQTTRSLRGGPKAPRPPQKQSED